MAAGPADERHIADLIIDQIEFSSLLLLNKCDLVCPVRPSLLPKTASLQCSHLHAPLPRRSKLHS